MFEDHLEIDLGGSELEQAIGRDIQPVVRSVRNWSEDHLGIGGTAAVGTALEAAATLGGLYGLKTSMTGPLLESGVGSTLERGAFHESWGRWDEAVTSSGMSGLVRTRSELRLLDTSDFTNAQKGLLGESRASLVCQRTGYSELEAPLPSNNGFDGVFLTTASLSELRLVC